MSIRSKEGRDPAYVRFTNKTGRLLDIIWINYYGDWVLYGRLKPHEFMDVDTFKTHPWLFIDRTTGQKMQAGSGKIFYPASSGETLQRIGPTGVMKFREHVIIRLPMYTLREISLMEISQHLKNEDDIESLELPSGLLKELKETLCTKIIFDHMYE